tara:strand:- start:761 stop:1690 length:930 start_codon:yes stop_codon:yes gene_type:complete
MKNFTISNLAYQLGSIKTNYDKLKKKHPDWEIDNVKKKTGINNLYLSGKNEDVLNLSVKSCKKSLKNFHKDKIDCVIVITQTAKNKLPSISCMIQNKLKLKKNILAFDISLGCSGFVYGLAVINSLFISNTAKCALLVCCDTYNKFLNENNRTCKTVFSDAASSCIVKKKSFKKNYKFSFLTDGSGAKDLIEIDNNIEMIGSNIFQFTTANVPKLFRELLKINNLKKNQIKYFIFHQASKLVLDQLKKILNIPDEKFPINYDKVGNTVSSSIPILLKELQDQKKLRSKDKIMLIGFGVGLSASAYIIEW